MDGFRTATLTALASWIASAPSKVTPVLAVTVTVGSAPMVTPPPPIPTPTGAVTTVHKHTPAASIVLTFAVPPFTIPLRVTGAESCTQRPVVTSASRVMSRSSIAERSPIGARLSAKVAVPVRRVARASATEDAERRRRAYDTVERNEDFMSSFDQTIVSAKILPVD